MVFLTVVLNYNIIITQLSLGPGWLLACFGFQCVLGIRPHDRTIARIRTRNQTPFLFLVLAGFFFCCSVRGPRVLDREARSADFFKKIYTMHGLRPTHTLSPRGVLVDSK